jgi:hypothetical protein
MLSKQKNKQTKRTQVMPPRLPSQFTETVTTTRTGVLSDLFQGWNELYLDSRQKQNKEIFRPSGSKENSPYPLRSASSLLA